MFPSLLLPTFIRFSFLFLAPRKERRPVVTLVGANLVAPKQCDLDMTTRTPCLRTFQSIPPAAAVAGGIASDSSVRVLCRERAAFRFA